MLSKRFLSSARLGDVITLLGSLFQCLTTLGEEPPPNVQPKPSLTQLHALGLIWWSLERKDQHLTLCFLSKWSCRLWWGLLSDFSMLSKPSDFSHSSYILASRAFTIFVAFRWTFSNSFYILHILWCTKPHMVVEVILHQCRVVRDDHSPQLTGNTVLDAPQDTFGPFGCQVLLLTASNLLSIRTHKSLSVGLLCSLSC